MTEHTERAAGVWTDEQRRELGHERASSAGGKTPGTGPRTPSEARQSHTVRSVTMEIEAPARFVWGVLTDYANYPQWNPYTVAVATTLEIGEPIDLTLPAVDGSDSTFVNREYVRIVDPPRHLQYDTGEEMPGIFAIRDQWVTELGPNRCAYHTTDTITGKYADKVMEMTGDWIKAGFDSVARALKARAESLVRHA